MSSPTEKLDIVVGAFPTDATLYNINGVRTLFLGVDQTFGRAVSNVRNVLPDLTLEAAERMIREQCPEFRDIDDMLGITTPVPASVERPPAPPATPVKAPARARNRKVVLVAALLPALAASWALGRFTVGDDTPPVKTAASTPDATPDGGTAAQAPFADSDFEFFSGSSKIDCDPMSTLEAECTDSDGMVMATKAATGPDSTIFTFSYGKERIGLRVFYDASYAKTWARQDGSQELYPHLQVHDRYVLWGTDEARIAEYMDLLKKSDPRRSNPSVMGGATPLPTRLAALTLGTLGFDDDQAVQQLMATSSGKSSAPAVLAARLLLALDPAPPGAQGGGEDIVALAAGLDPSRQTSGTVVAGPVVQPDPAPSVPDSTANVTAPADPAPEAGTSSPEPSTPETSTPSTGTTSPTAPEEKPQEPEKETPTAPPAPDPTPTAPPEEETPVTPTPPAEETPSAPVEEEPAPPQEETPEAPEAPPVQLPAEPGGQTPEQGTEPGDGQDVPVPGADPGQGAEDRGDDLLILNSPWTVAPAA